MYLIELIFKKDIIDAKIEELKKELKSHPSETVAEELYLLIEKKQSILLSIDAANNISSINIGGTEVSINAAIIIKKTIKNKIDTLTSLINDLSCELDKVTLQKQRDKYLEEYTLLKMGVMRNDLQIKIG